MDNLLIFVVIPVCAAMGAPLLFLVGYALRKQLRIALTVLFLILGLFLVVAVVHELIVGSPDAKFTAAARELDRVLTTTGNTDGEVLAACTAVHDAYKMTDVSSLPREKAAAMKSVADAAKLWQLQLTVIKVDALSTALGYDKSREAGMDMEVARMTLPGVRTTIEDYLKKYK